MNIISNQSGDDSFKLPNIKNGANYHNQTCNTEINRNGNGYRYNNNTNFRLLTKFSKSSIMHRDHYPEQKPVESNIFRYYCPICLRFFNSILVTSCCNNYICRFCIGHLAKKAKLSQFNENSSEVKCSHC